MTGDAALGITPVMKWNFERSCYRWLVTRHPAQFERMDFTAQILQSASRARKAFFECGWEEAKVLIRPSEGKFERTPFFDTIIRRGLRNSTRFDASTLTEEEIEKLGMHRDETLGFKLQIRQFRNSSRKELAPLRRSGGGGGNGVPGAPRQRESNLSLPPTGRSPHTIAGVRTQAAVGSQRGAMHSPPRESSAVHSHVREPWGDEGGRFSASSRGWTEEQAWQYGVGRALDAPAERSRFMPWDSTRRWNYASGGSAASGDRKQHYITTAEEERRVVHTQQEHFLSNATRTEHATRDNGSRERFSSNGPGDRFAGAVGGGGSGGGGGGGTSLPARPWAQPAAPSSDASRGRAVWQPQAPATWGVDSREPTWAVAHARETGATAGSAASDMGDMMPTRGGGDDANLRDHRRTSESTPASTAVADGLPGRGIRQEEGDVRPGFCHQMQRLGRSPNELRAPTVLRNSSGPPRDNLEAGDVGLLTQGYRRLAAMNDGHVMSGKAQQSQSVSHASRGSQPRSSDGPCIQGESVCGNRRSHQEAYPLLDRRACSPGSGDGPSQKKQRQAGAENQPISNSPLQKQAGAAQGRGGSDRAKHDVKTWPLVARPATPPDRRCDILAKELEESERVLTSARRARDLAQARFEEATRAHRAKREQVMDATGQRTAEPAQMLDKCASLHSLARSCEAASAAAAAAAEQDQASPDENEEERKAGAAKKSAGERCAVMHAPHDPGNTADRLSNDDRRLSSGADRADEMREVKMEAALLCEIGRASRSPASTRSPAQARNSVSAESGSNGPTSTVDDGRQSRRIDSPEGRPVRPSPVPSPLPNLARVIPSGTCTQAEYREAGRVAAGEEADKHVGTVLRARVGSPARHQQHHHHQNHHHQQRGASIEPTVFPPPALATPSSRDGAAVHPVDTHRPAMNRGPLPSLPRVPGSPSASGDTDSDHSDSTSGVGATVDEGVGAAATAAVAPTGGAGPLRKRLSHDQRGSKERSAHRRQHGGGRGSWVERSEAKKRADTGRCDGGGCIAPLARLAAIATAGAGGHGTMEGLRCV